MRVTSNTFPNSLIDQLNLLNQRQNKLQNQAATGQLVHLPEDDPVAMRRILDLQTEAKSVSQYERNIARHQEVASGSFSVMKSVKTVLDRARELAISADGLKSQDQLDILANEVSGLIKQAVQAVNATNRGDYLFGGTISDQPPFVIATDTDGNVTSVVYQGNTTLAESEVAKGVTLSSQAVGENAGGSGPRGLIADTRVGADLFNHLIALQDNLLAGDVATIENVDRAALGQDEDNILYHLGGNAALQGRLETSLSLAHQRTDDLEKLVSREADADLAQTIVRLTQTQTAYEAALQSAGRILSSSLMDYLR